MKNPMRWTALLVAAASAAAFGQTADPDAAVPTTITSTTTRTTTQTTEVSQITSWPKDTQTAARALIEKYGQPDVESDRMLTWNDKDPWNRVTLLRTGVKDTFPVNHVSYIEHTVSYDVPKDRTHEIENFDPALTVDQDAKTITSRSDTEAGNILALNLADEVARGRIDAGKAREIMRKRWDEHLSGKSSPYTDHLMFTTKARPIEEAPDEDVEPAAP